MVLGSLNINSLLPHVDEIQTVLKERGIHFLALYETKLDDTCSDATLNIEGYGINLVGLTAIEMGEVLPFTARSPFNILLGMTPQDQHLS